MKNDIINCYYKEVEGEAESIFQMVFRQNDEFFDIFDRRPVFNVLRMRRRNYWLDSNYNFYVESRKVKEINGNKPWEALSEYRPFYQVNYLDGSMEILEYPLVNNENVYRNCFFESEGILYIKISDFAQVDCELLKRSQKKELYIDLRGNSGGKIPAMLNVLRKFIDGDLFGLLHKGAMTIVRAESKPYTYKKIIIYVDDETASVAEFFALTMQKRLGAQVIGTPTYGKWVAQEVICVQGYFVKVPRYIYASLDGIPQSNKKGIIPDILLDTTEIDRIIQEIRRGIKCE